ncbi:hypothetical protein BHS06_28000 [Myxococcus xanthus]|uniref:hypothetical protein n=1 Tax=Myxococcus TaxID=32 RepID=UPI00112DF60C|nr:MULTISPECIES: hypothetical protein [Myxococcus]QDE92511.1 hypothetical protein BHS06_28000 [Myxococcus xanthus]WNZ60672.1 hypothetical protein QEG98_32675 [Myxococcus sp. MxC21-1]
MQTTLLSRPIDVPWRTAALSSAAVLTASNVAALVASLRLAPLLRHRLRPRSRALPALAVGATALGALAIGALSIGTLAIRALTIGKLRGDDWQVDSLRVGSLQVVETIGPTGSSGVGAT